MSKFSSKLGGVTHKTIKSSLNKVDPELRNSIGTMIAYIINDTWVKLKILPFNWEGWNTRQKSPCQMFMRETKILTGIQLELYWVVYAVPMSTIMNLSKVFTPSLNTGNK